MKSKRTKHVGSFGLFLLGMIFILFLGIAYGGEGTPVQLVSVSPAGGSYVSNTPEITLTYDKNVANITVRENNQSKISFVDSSGNEVLYHVEIADDEIYPLLRREIKVQVLEPLSPGTYKLLIAAGIGAKNGTFTGKSYTFYYRVKESKPVEPTEPSTEAPTEAPTEALTEAPTEALTEAPTEAPTEATSESEESTSEASTESEKTTKPEKEPSKKESTQASQDPSKPDLKPSESKPGPGGEGENPAEPSGEVDPSGTVDPSKRDPSKTDPSKAEPARTDPSKTNPSKAVPSAQNPSPSESTKKEESSSIAEENLLLPDVIQEGEQDGMQTVVLNRIILTDNVEEGESLQAYEDRIIPQQEKSQEASGGGIPEEWLLGFILFVTGLIYRILYFRQSIKGKKDTDKKTQI